MLIDKEMAEVIMMALDVAEHESLLSDDDEAFKRVVNLINDIHPDVAKRNYMNLKEIE